jgi:hypothetical protein
MNTSKPASKPKSLPRWEITDTDRIAAGQDPRQLHFGFYEPLAIQEQQTACAQKMPNIANGHGRQRLKQAVAAR